VGTDHKHTVCTYDEARAAIEAHEEIFVNNCFCRTPAHDGKANWEYCGHPLETCMGFHRPDPADDQYEYRQISQKEALALHTEWMKQGNLFRFMEDERWICFCCSCGCMWFRDQEGNRVQDTCDKSAWIEKTDSDLCNLCGLCLDVCAYDARSIEGTEMLVNSGQCWGCSACEYVCPEGAIEMIGRS
jgi:ferredoxin